MSGGNCKDSYFFLRAPARTPLPCFLVSSLLCFAPFVGLAAWRQLTSPPTLLPGRDRVYDLCTLVLYVQTECCNDVSRVELQKEPGRRGIPQPRTSTFGGLGSVHPVRPRVCPRASCMGKGECESQNKPLNCNCIPDTKAKHDRHQ